jgi:hypothetical protein
MARNFFFICSGLFFLVSAVALARVVVDSGRFVAGVQAVAGGEGVVVVTQDGETYLMRFGSPYNGLGNIHDGDMKGTSH